jgi:hypothetical protein
MVSELGGADNTPPTPFSPGVDEVRFPTPFVQPRSLLIRALVTTPCHRPSSTCTQVRVPRAPTSPENKCSSANNAFRAPVLPANLTPFWPGPRKFTPHPHTDDPCVCNSSSSQPFFRLVSSSPGLPLSISHLHRFSTVSRFCRGRDPLCLVPSPRRYPSNSCSFHPRDALPADAEVDFSTFGYASIFVDIPASTPTVPYLCTAVQRIPAA